MIHRQSKELDNTPMSEYTVLQGVKKPRAKLSAKTSEGKVKVRVREVLDTYGTQCWYFMPMTRGYSRSGVPDFIGCIYGKMFSIETKSIHSSHKVTALQQLELGKIKTAGGLALVIDENNINTLRSVLDEYLNS